MSLDWKSASVSHDDMARISAPHAAALIKQAHLTQDIPGPLKIFENAAGSGVGTTAILAALGDRNDLTVLAGDINKPFLDVFKARRDHYGWVNVEIRMIDAMDNKLPDDTYTHVVTNFGIMLMPEPITALRECTRVLAPTGTIAFSTWEQVGWVWDVKAALELIPDAPPFPHPDKWMQSLSKAKTEADRQKWDQVDWIRELMVQEGYSNVKVEKHTAYVELASPEEWAQSGFVAFLSNILTGMWGKELYDRLKDQIPDAMRKQATHKYGEGKSFRHEYISILTTGTKP